MKNSDELSVSNLSQAADYYENEYLQEQKTRYVRFDNNTHDFTVEVFLYEVRQKRDLPPPSGYDEWTGVTVGAQNIGRGQSRTVYLQKKVIGDFADAGLLNVKHVPTGRVTRTFNFRDRVARPGYYFERVIWGIKQTTATEHSTTIRVEFTGILSDGSIVTEEFEEIMDLYGK